MIHLDLEQLKNIGQENLKKQRIYYIILGILFAVTGVLCFAKPMVSGWAISILMGIMFIAGGIILILTTLFFKSLPYFAEILKFYKIAVHFELLSVVILNLR